MSKNERVMKLKLTDIFIDPELKVRVETDEATAKEYYDAMETEDDLKKFPKPTVYFDGCRYMLVDGHHRYLAATWRKHEMMEFIVINGTRDEAILAAVKLNLTNGLRFNEGDWEKIVSVIASKEQWKDWSNRKLAEELKCSEITVRRYRPDPAGATGVAPEKRMGKDGKMYPVKARKKEEAVVTEPEQAEPIVTEERQTIEPTPSSEVVEIDMPEAETASGEESPSIDQHQNEVNVKQTQIEATVSLLETQLIEWLELVLPNEGGDFKQAIGNRLHALANDLMNEEPSATP